MISRLLIGFVLLVCGVLPLRAQNAEWLQAHYTKREVQVPMRDGVQLFTAIYTPVAARQPLPFLLNRTPYGISPYGKHHFPGHLGPSEIFATEGFIFVYQDVRGRFMSGGNFINMTPHKARKSGHRDVDESTDTFDTIAWLLKHVKGHNGRVGQWGISYPGFYAAAGMIDAHPALVAVSPQAPIMDWFMGDDFHRNGALWLPHFFNFIANFGRVRTGRTNRWPEPFQHGTDDGYDFFLKLGPLQNANRLYFHDGIPFWNEVMTHGTYDAFWQSRNLRAHLKQIRPEVLVVGGWFDAENLYGSLQLHKTLNQQSPETREHLVMGPWYHGAWERNPGEVLGDMPFESATSTYFLNQVELPYFLHLLKDGPDPKLPKVLVFRTGLNRWERFGAWPPESNPPLRVYFQAAGGLSAEPPKEAKGFEEFLSDPAKPVPFYAGKQIGMPKDYMVADQRFVADRSDVVGYQTPTLDADLSVAGPIRVHLIVSTSGTDADWVVKVIDVQPESTSSGTVPEQLLIRGEVMRGKFRNDPQHPEPFVPNQPTPVDFSLNDICHTFRKGHRLMVQVQSSWFPLMDRNPQVFTDINAATEADFHSATHRVYRNSSLASYLELPILKEDPPRP